MLAATLYTWQDPVALALVLTTLVAAGLRAGRWGRGAGGGCRTCPAAKLHSVSRRARR